MDETTLDAIKDKQATFIDVREQSELDEYGKLEKAKHIPIMDIPQNIDEIANFAKPIILFCKSGQRASRAKEFLNDNGIERVFNGGGYSDVIEILGNQE